MIRALFVLVFLAPYTIAASVAGYGIARLVGSPALLYGLARLGIRVALFLAGTRIVVEGRDLLGDHRNTVIVANHVSHLDAPVLFEALGTDFKAVVKKEIFSWPFLGPVLRRAGFIAVNRRDRIQAGQALSRAAKSLQDGACFLVFPEGTRSRTGQLGTFKKGGFVIGIEAKSRIVPVVVQGGRELMPAGGFRIRSGTVRVRVLDPVDAAGYSYADRDRLATEVHARIAAALEVARPGRGGDPTPA